MKTSEIVRIALIAIVAIIALKAIALKLNVPGLRNVAAML